MSDFLRELEEDIREEKILRLWHKYGNILIGFALILVVGTGAYVLWQHLKEKAQIKAHVAFSQAVTLLQQGKKEEALKRFQELGQEGGGYGKLAQLYEASLLPDPKELYEKISKENVADYGMSKLPKILEAARALQTSENLSFLEPLAAPNNAWAPLSLELLALGNVKKGDSLKAAELYIQLLKEAHLTPDETLRATLMLSQLEVPPVLWESLQNQESQQ